jgi:small-conductance mechanosensitive channel
MGKRIFIIFLTSLLLMPAAQSAQEIKTGEKKEAAPKIQLSENIDETVRREAEEIKKEITGKLESLTARSTLEWNKRTISYASGWLITLPSRTPELLSRTAQHGKVVGLSGSIILFLFLAALFYSFFWRKSLVAWLAGKLQALFRQVSGELYPYVLFSIDIITCALIPALLLGFYGLIKLIFKYDFTWYQYIGRLLWLWFFATIIIRAFKVLLTHKEVSPRAAAGRGPNTFRWIRVIIIYSVAVLAVFWGAEIFEVRNDVVALIKFVVSLSIIAFVTVFLLKRRTIISVLPKLENPVYKMLIKFIRFFYYPLLAITLSGALLWVFGYAELGLIILTKIWTTSVAFITLILIHHTLTVVLNTWIKQHKAPSIQAQQFARSLKSILYFATILATIIIVLNLLGLLNPLQRLMSFTLVQVGESEIKLWLILKAVIIIISFAIFSKFLQSYLNFKIYPKLGVDPGLGFVLNTLLKYVLFAIAIGITLSIIGIDLKFLLVFAGAIGIGIGLGLQSLAANVISGFTIIFGRKIRKGDWIEIEGKLGQATDIYLRATRIKTRDDIEYLIPNSNFVNNSIINYSYSSPLIRIHLPLGVSYASDPAQVKEILLKVTENEEMVAKNREPIVRFMGYGNSSIDFELLVWTNVKQYAIDDVKSSLYFTIFKEFKQAGITIPFPQRDVHIIKASNLEVGSTAETFG